MRIFYFLNQRRIFLLVLFFLVVSTTPLFSQNWLAIANQKDKSGFINEEGKWQVKPVFDEVTGFHNGLSAVRSGESWGYINNQGDFVIQPEFDKASPFYNKNFALVEKDHVRYYINRKGEFLINHEQNLVIFYEDIAAYPQQNKFGFINKNYQWEILPQYDQVWPFRNGIAKVKKAGQWIYVNRHGKEIYDIQLDYYQGSGKLLLFKKSKEGLWGFVDDEDEWIISPLFEDVKMYSDGLAPAKKDNKWGYIDMSGNFRIPPFYDNAFGFRHGLGCIEMNGNYGCIDERGKIIIKPRFENPLIFHFAENFFVMDPVTASNLSDIVSPAHISVPDVDVEDHNIYRPDETRLALVIGNGNYTHGGFLSNPENDARSMAESLKRLGFETIVYYNVDQVKLKQAIDEFGNRLRQYETGLFFYAGHGIQVKGYNYLIPVDASMGSEIDVEYNCVEAGRVLSRMEESGSSTNIVILDACRDNPFERSWTRKAQGQGLAFMNAPSGSLIAYATSPGSTASDGPGKNGLYTSSLLKFMNNPGITILEVFQRVRSEVRTKSNNRQTPWESTSLEGNFYFRK
jgi:hypothetical protein